MADGVIAATILATFKGDRDWDTMDVRAVGVSSSYTFNAAHDNLDDLTNIITDAVAVTGEAVSAATGGMKFDHDDYTLTGVNGTVAAIYDYDHNGGADSARALLARYTSGIAAHSLSGGSLAVTMHANGAVTATSSPS